MEREWRGSSEDVVGDAYGGVRATTGEYRQIRVPYTAQAAGNRIDVFVFSVPDEAPAGAAFLVDAIALAEGGGTPTPSEC